MSDLDDFVVAGLSKKEKATRLIELLEARGVDVDDIFKVKSIKAWQSMHKDGENEAVVTDLRGITLIPNWDQGPEWPVVQPAAPVSIRPSASKPRKDDVTRILLLPDTQIAFRLFVRDGVAHLEPTHDERAMDVALQLVKLTKPDIIVNLGDLLDLPEFGRFEQSPEFQQTTQQAIDAAYRFLAQQRALAPDAAIHLLEGNHDRRLPNAVRRNAMAALRLRRAEAPQGWPALSVPHLLRLTELGVEYVDGYPAGKVALPGGVFAIHGQAVASNSSTAAKVANSSHQSLVFGHVHRVELHFRTVEDGDGNRCETFAMTPGCLCRVDGAVPSYHSSESAGGDPVPYFENWQQGVGIIDVDSSGVAHPEVVRIIDGRASWRGSSIEAN